MAANNGTIILTAKEVATMARIAADKIEEASRSSETMRCPATEIIARLIRETVYSPDLEKTARGW